MYLSKYITLIDKTRAIAWFLLLFCNYGYSQLLSKKITFTDFNYGANVIINKINDQLFVSTSGKAPTMGYAYYNLNARLNYNLDTLETIVFYTPNTNSLNTIFTRPFKSIGNTIIYSISLQDYNNNGQTYIYAKTKPNSLEIQNYKAYTSKHNFLYGHDNFMINDSLSIRSLAVAPNGNFGLPIQIALHWIDNQLDTINQKLYYNSGKCFVRGGVYVDANKDLIVGGYTDTLGMGDLLFMRLDSLGNVKYAKSIGTNREDVFSLLKINKSYYLVGISDSIPITGQKISNLIISKLDTNGAPLKTSKINFPFNLNANFLINKNNNIVYSGESYFTGFLGGRATYIEIDTNATILNYKIEDPTNYNETQGIYESSVFNDSLKNIFLIYNKAIDGDNGKRLGSIMKLDSNTIGCYQGLSMTYTTTVINGQLHCSPINIRTAKDSLFEPVGSLMQMRGLNNFTLDCESYVGIKEHGIENKNFKLYPNPTVNHLEIETEEEIDHIKVYNQLGSEVSFKFSSEKSIDVQSLPSGVYFIELKTANGVSRQKFIKQ